MDKKSLLGAILIAFVITGYFAYNQQNRLNNQSDSINLGQKEIVQEDTILEESTINDFSTAVAANDLKEDEIPIETNLLKFVFTNKGGTAKEIIVKEEKNISEDVNFLFTGDSGEKAFNLYIDGNLDNPLEDLLYHEHKEKDERGYQELVFYRNYIGTNNEEFTLRKTFAFYDDEYLITAKIEIENKDAKKVLNLNKKNNYAFSFGPQIGPEFDKLKKRYDYRDFGYFSDKKLRKATKSISTTDAPQWAAIYSKYFTAILTKSPNTQNLFIKKEEKKPNLIVSNEIYMVSRAIVDYKVNDSYKIYMGPKVNSVLEKYNKADNNNFLLDNSNFDKVGGKGFLYPIVVLLRVILDWMYSWSGNYGVAIILLTVIVKILIFPITRKSYQSSTEMQSITPKVNALKEKYRDNPQKMNEELAKLYKEAGVNPMKGCLPMLIQMPIFIAMYQVCLNHFALRGKPFMLWISDLSLPEAVYNFDFETSIGFLQNFDAIRILPILFVGTQIISTKIMQGKNASSNGSMKFMIYGMPLVFFFVLYSAPSGLFVYWITSNLITLLQQVITNAVKKNKNPAQVQGKQNKQGPGKKVIKKKR